MSLGVVALVWASLAGAAESSQKIRIPLLAKQVSLDPSGIQDQSSLLVSRQLNCQLVRNRSRQIVNEAAKEIRYLSDRDIEFVLDPGARFHSGKPVQADDVVASLRYLQESRVVLRNVFRWVETVQALGKDRVRIRLKKAQPQFLNLISAPNYAIFERDFLKRAKKDPSLWKQPSGCGSYRVGSYGADSIVLEPVKAQHPIEFRLSAAQAKSSDFDLLPPGIEVQESSREDFSETDLFDPYHLFLGLNLRLLKWKDRATRCASLAKVNPKPVLDSYGSQAQVATTFFPRGVLGFSESLNYLEYYKNEAPPAGSETVQRGCLSILGVSIPPIHRAALSKMWFAEDAGAKPAAVIENPKDYGRTFAESGCDALVLGLKSNYLDGYEYLLIFSEEAANFTGYQDADLKSLINQSQDLEPTQRAAQYQRASQRIRDACVIAPLATLPNRRVFVSKRLTLPELGSVPFNETPLAGGLLK